MSRFSGGSNYLNVLYINPFEWINFYSLVGQDDYGYRLE